MQAPAANGTEYMHETLGDMQRRVVSSGVNMQDQDCLASQRLCASGTCLGQFTVRQSQNQPVPRLQHGFCGLT
jgi:hypothetical protein